MEGKNRGQDHRQQAVIGSKNVSILRVLYQPCVCRRLCVCGTRERGSAVARQV